MKSIVLFLLVTSSMAMASDIKNKVEISTDGIGFNYSETNIDSTESGSSNTYELQTTTLKLNYSRKIFKKLWLEGQYIYNSNKRIFENGNDETETVNNIFYAGLIYDFSEEHSNSWSIFGGLISNTTKNIDGDLTLSLDGFRIGAAKRWGLDFINIPNLSFELALIIEDGSVDSDTINESFNGYNVNYIPSARFQLFF